MTPDNPLIKAEEGVEALALIIARYYRSLLQEGVPPDTASALALQFQAQHLQQAASRRAMSAFGTWLEKQKQAKP